MTKFVVKMTVEAKAKNLTKKNLKRFIRTNLISASSRLTENNPFYVGIKTVRLGRLDKISMK